MNRTVLSCLAAAALQFVPMARAQNYTITTFAGNNNASFFGDAGPATAASLNGPHDMAVNAAGTIVYIADPNNQRIRAVQSGAINTVAGNGVLGYYGDGGAATSAEVYNPLGVAVDSSGNFFIADFGNNLVRKVTSGGIISTVAGNYTQGGGANGNGGLAINAQLASPSSVAVDSAGNLYIADAGNSRIQKVAASTGIVTTFAGTGVAGLAGDGLLAKNAQLYQPLGIALDSAGNLYIADSTNNRVRKVAASTNIITTIAGSTTGFGGDGGPATAAKLNHPIGVAVDNAGNVYIADSLNNRIRMVTPSGIITTIAGNGRAAYLGDYLPATQASLSSPAGVAVDKNGNVYVADTQNNVIRLLTPTAGSAPTITGAASASDFGALTSVSPGTWMEIYGANLASDSRLWTNSDFTGVKAPTSLDFTSAYVGGVPAYVEFISGTQVNVQVPSTVATGSQPVVLSAPSGLAGPFNINVNTVSPGLLSPASFNVGGKQYVTALFSDGQTYVLPPGSIAGVTSRQAKAGDVITLYGVGFGTVNPSSPAGQVVQTLNSLTGTFQIMFGSTPATILYAGLAPNTVGEYQFNVIVPAVTASNSVPITFTLNGTAGTQTLYTAVQ